MKRKPTTQPPTPRRVPRRMLKPLHARAATSEKDFEEYEGASEPNMKFSHALIVVLLLHVLAVGGVFAFNALKGRHLPPDRAKPAAGRTAQAATPEAASAPAIKAAAQAREPAHALPAASGKASPKTQPADAAATHTVVPGDTLTRIAANNKTTVDAIEQANGLAGSSALRVGQVLKIPAKSGPPKAPEKQETAAAKTAESKPSAPDKTAAAKAAETKASAPDKTAEAKPPAAAAKNPEVKPAPVAKAKETATPTKPSDDGPAKPAASEKSYTVAKGDNPYSIAKKFKVKYKDLIKANDIKDPTKLQIGQKLIVP